MILTYRYRVKNLAGELNRQARAVDYVWNFANETQRKAVAWGRRWLTGFDLIKLTSGSSKELCLPAKTIEAVCQQYAKSRIQQRRPWLRWRGNKSLGWIPLKAECIKPIGDDFRIGGRVFHMFLSRNLPLGGRIRDGSSFAQDARGNWFLNLVLELPEAPQREGQRAVGIDLGLKDLATLSTGEKIANPRHYANEQDALAKAQRARKKRQARNIHARIENRRRDGLHKLSTRIVREFDVIAVGDVRSSGKSVADASWSTFRRMLAYKSITNGARYEEVSERFTTQTCSDCGSVGGPKGREGLAMRQWKCGDCGTVHDRDVNAARNILARLRHQAPVEGVAA